MRMGEAAELLRKLGDNEKHVLYKANDGTEITVTKTCKLSPLDFAVGLILPGDGEFFPTHIRLLIDLFIKKMSNASGAIQLFRAFEQMNSGDDPQLLGKELLDIQFPMKFDSAEVNLMYAQLLLIEQDINYTPPSTKRSKLDPPREYTMRFVRWVASKEAEIDKIIFAAAGRRYPAPARYSEKMF